MKLTYKNNKNNLVLAPIIRDSLKITGGFLGFLLLFEIIVNLLFPYPQDPQNTNPGTLPLYFDYGKSIEGKVRRQLGTSNENSAPIAQAGWFNSENWQKQPNKPQTKQDKLVAIYGMSFTNDVAKAINKINPQITIRRIDGPTAPPNHSFAAYSLDRKNHDADVVVWGILASSVQGMNAMSGMTWNAEFPAPFTFPKYYLKQGDLKAIWPSIDSLESLRLAKQDETKWDTFVKQLEDNDKFYNTFSFEQNFLDNSAIVRMIRRAWTQNYKNQKLNQIHTSEGFNQKWEGIAVLNKMVKQFAQTAKADGKVPIVLVINNVGYDEHLFKAIQPTLNKESIPYISTHKIVPASDMSNFISDGHFTPEANQKIAQELLELIEKQE